MFAVLQQPHVDEVDPGESRVEQQTCRMFLSPWMFGYSLFIANFVAIAYVFVKQFGCHETLARVPQAWVFGKGQGPCLPKLHSFISTVAHANDSVRGFPYCLIASWSLPRGS